MSTPKPRDVSAITQVDKQPSLMQRMAQKGKVPKKTRSTLKNSTSKAQTLEVPDLEAKIGPGDIYEVPPDDVVHVLANPKASAVKSKAKKPIVYSSKATTNKSSISKTIGQPKKILPGHASKMNTVKTKPPGKKGLKKPQVDKATDSKIEAQESTPTQDPKATKSVKAAAQKYPIKKSYAAKSSSTTTTQGQTQQEENFSGLNDQSNQESNDDIALEEILPRRELPPSDDNKSNKVTGTKSIETKSSRNMKHVINRETEKSGKGFATGLSGFLSGFDNIDGNLGPADPSNIQYNLSATADLLMQVEDPPTRASVNHASHDLQAAEHDAAVVETVASDRPIELVLSSGFSDSSSKRKSNVDEIHPQKRKRAETPRLSPPRRSPRLQSKHHETAGRAESRRVIQDELQNDSAVQLEVQPMSAKSAIVSAPIRRTPAGKARDIEQPNLVLRDDREHRKVNMIHFSKEGPMNQGKLNGTPRPIEGAPVTTSQSQQQRQKRKFQVGQGAEVKSPPRKKRFSTPIEPPEGAIPLETRQQDIEVQSGAEVQNVHLEPPIQPKVDSTIGQAIIGKELVDNHVTINRSSPSPIEAMRFEAIKGGRPNRKSSSQGSRVAANGSPLPILSVQRMNHTKKVKENLKQTSMDMATEGVEERVKDGANIFGPRVRLESQTKSKPSPPRKFEPRYVAHRKTKSGNYQGMTTREVIGPESNLPDPFVDPTRKPSGFANRLRTSSGIQSEIDDTAKRNKAANVQTATKTNRKSRSSNVFVNDAERTLVGEQSYEIQSKASLPSMSSGNSSSNSEARSPLRDVPNGMWNVALRPHYRSLKDAVHRVADEMLIRLSDKEEAIGLVVDQYENNASRLVNSMLMLRTEDKSSMARGLLQRRSVMVQAYSEAVRSVTQSTATIRESPVAIFEKDWKTAQSQIKEKIKEGRGT
ncbi:hypothetical protein BJ875DRAFT_456989 [Amylocarpus encephaloides]|uniref:Uncharacterized protein n=1 Tax=Amylocarpus encephaloides TaxID=45428 RepID=A0A9P7YNJ6_9HELO|nr:hypothetical protein BJ875DRAFT_456989 [Amylocarpus encephaloides]